MLIPKSLKGFKLSSFTKFSEKNIKLFPHPLHPTFSPYRKKFKISISVYIIVNTTNIFSNEATLLISNNRLTVRLKRFGGNIIDSLMYSGIDVIPPAEASPWEQDPFIFEPIEDHVADVSKRWYKSIRKLIRHLLQVSTLLLFTFFVPLIEV